MYKKKGRSWRKHFDFMMIDICCSGLAFYFGYFIRHRVSAFSDAGAMYLQLWVLFVAVSLCISSVRESYKNIVRRGYLVEFGCVCSFYIMSDMAILLYLFLAKKSSLFSRESIILFFTLSIIFSYLVRCLRKHGIRVKLRRNPDVEQMLVVTTRKHAEFCIKTLFPEGYQGYRVVGIAFADTDNLISELEAAVTVDDNNKKDHEERLDIPVVAGYRDIPEYVLSHVVDSVFLDAEILDERRLKIARELQKAGIVVHVNLIQMPYNFTGYAIEKMGEYLVYTSGMCIASDTQMFRKRFLDIFGGLAGSVLTVLVGFFVAPIIFFQSPGPIIFVQKRVGKNGRVFKMYKFRSMYRDAEARKKELMNQNEMNGLMFKMDHDPRITPIGRFIRKHSIDELPQFFNVLKGDMSLVGTRPPTVDEYEQYELHHKGRLGLKPGITGLWQVSGRNDIKDFEKVVQLDTEYIANWSLGLDIRILCSTVRNVLTGDGAK